MHILESEEEVSHQQWGQPNHKKIACFADGYLCPGQSLFGWLGMGTDNTAGGWVWAYEVVCRKRGGETWRRQERGECGYLPPLRVAAGYLGLQHPGCVLRSVSFVAFFSFSVSQGKLDVVWVTPCTTQAQGTMFRLQCFENWSVC